jgi:HNH endonuclease
MAGPVIETVRQHIAWSYANLARAHAAVEAGAGSYGPVHHMIRSRLYKGLTTGKMQMRSLYDDERVKFVYPQACCYCGSTKSLSIDHVIPRLKGGKESADNLVSKGSRDLLEWYLIKESLPSLLLLRRYVKLVARYCAEHEILDETLEAAAKQELPFRLDLLPCEFPALNTLVLWVPATQQD